ncbi:hypothetical protein HPB49_025231 [Dermacentor silvarum]|uniref:Uncharacterized protein n=1 Tax=Dermacentor silvarum TaxID=543639 RepID=A0ACB8DHM2_DERSI|nr:hypothetical protein HPB49_025231 [Dermacentor silvarum]
MPGPCTTNFVVHLVTNAAPVLLAARGYNVYKSIPYGPPSDLLLYLARRASENRSVLSSPVVERRMLAAEIRRRLARSWKRPVEPAHD